MIEIQTTPAIAGGQTSVPTITGLDAIEAVSPVHGRDDARHRRVGKDELEST
jgi:hypothetical protein